MPYDSGSKSSKSYITQREVFFLIKHNDKKIGKNYKNLNDYIDNNTHEFTTCNNNDLIDRLYDEVGYMYNKYFDGKHESSEYTTKLPYRKLLSQTSSDNSYDDQSVPSFSELSVDIKKPSLKFPKSMMLLRSERIKEDSSSENTQLDDEEEDKFVVNFNDIINDVNRSIFKKKKLENNYKQKERIRPIYPNYVKLSPDPVSTSFLHDEPKNVILSVYYTKYIIDKANRVRQRAFSGNLHYPYYGDYTSHTHYFGNFGFVDGVESFKQIPLQKEKKPIKLLPNLPKKDFSRESFLALSHMYNLRKLLGNDGKSIIGGNSSKLTMILKRWSNDSKSSTDSSHSNTSTAFESVDFDLMRNFTDRMIEPKIYKKDSRKSKFLSVRKLRSTIVS